MIPDNPDNEAADPLVKKFVSYSSAYAAKAMYAAWGSIQKNVQKELQGLQDGSVGDLAGLSGALGGANKTGLGGLASMMKLMQTLSPDGSSGGNGGLEFRR